jgi:CBS domain containing-hemolysin-like protein
MFLTLLLIGGFVLINALFVAAEFGLVAAPRAAVEHRADGGDKLSRRLLGLLTTVRRQDRYLATSQLGITLASLGLGMYGEHQLARWLEPRLGFAHALRFVTAHALAGFVAIVGLTFIHIVIGEMAPKALAMQHPEGVARLLYWPMRVVLFVTYPLVAVLSSVGRWCLRLVGVTRQDDSAEQFYTPEELEIIVEESEQGGALHADAGRLLRELFDFGDLTVGQVMVPRVRVRGIPVGASPADVRAILLRHRHTRFPVYAGDLDHIVGMLHVKDLLRRLMRDESITGSDVRAMPVVPDTAPLDDVLSTMQRAQSHLAVVIDEHGGTAGVVSLDDLVEEVVGEITEGVSESRDFIRESETTVRVAGTVRLDELGQRFDLDLEHEDVDSVSGLVLARLGRPPVVGDVVDYGRLRIEVTSISGRGVREVRATLQAP